MRVQGDEDGSGDVAMKTGEMSHEKTRENPLGAFVEDAVEGRVLSKTGLTPVWCSGYGQNPGPVSSPSVCLSRKFDALQRGKM